VSFDDGQDDCEAETAARMGRRVTSPVETLEQAQQIIVGDAYPGVFDYEDVVAMFHCVGPPDHLILCRYRTGNPTPEQPVK
jgi:hypothetical protein